MPTSISKVQAKALAEGFFDNLGSDEEVQPRESLSTLIQLAGDIVDTAQTNLNAADNNASGALSASLKILNPELVNKNVHVDIEALYYWKFLNDGVRGTAGGAGKYVFKNNYVSKSMMKALRKWIIKEGIKSRTTRKYAAISKREAKRKSISDTSQATAYAIGTSIKKKGIPKNNFFTNAVQKTQGELIPKLGAALKIDIINSLPKQL